MRRACGYRCCLAGAALTRAYTDNDLAKAYQGPLFYCKDAFEGLHTMDRIMAGEAEAVPGGKTSGDRSPDGTAAAGGGVCPSK